MWTRIWHIGARPAELAEPGDYAVHDMPHESVILVRQNDGAVRAFRNVYQHRGNKLVWHDGSTVGAFTCAYHGWRYDLDGILKFMRDPDNFAGGDPRGRIRPAELPATHGADSSGTGWNRARPPTQNFQGRYHGCSKIKICNECYRSCGGASRPRPTGSLHNNFNESHHLLNAHTSMRIYVVEHHSGHQLKMHKSGHKHVVESGLLSSWNLDPRQHDGRPADSRLALQRRKRGAGPDRGHKYLLKLSDEELTDYFHHTLFPNVTTTASPNDGGDYVFRTEPARDDPGKYTFKYMALHPAIEGSDAVMTAAGLRKLEEPVREDLVYGVGNVGDLINEELSVAVQRQRGLHSRGYRNA